MYYLANIHNGGLYSFGMRGGKGYQCYFGEYQKAAVHGAGAYAGIDIKALVGIMKKTGFGLGIIAHILSDRVFDV